MRLALALLLQPFVAVLFFVAAYFIARWIGRRMPDGRWKRILFSPLDGKGRRG